MADEVLERLERIEAQLQALTKAVERLAGESGSTPDLASKETAAPSGAAGAVAPSPDPPGPAETVGAAEEAEAAADVPYGDLLTGLFRAALAVRPEACWEGLESLTHGDDLQAPRAVDHLRAFNWKRFRATAGSYLADGAADSWVVARTVPETIDDSTTSVKVYLQRAGANPAPVSIAREGGPQGPWRVRNLSL